MPGLLDPIRVGSLVIPNRLVMPSMVTGLASKDGKVTDALVEHYRQRASGVGLAIVEATSVESIPPWTDRPGIYNTCFVAGLQRLASTVKERGSRIAIQLIHSGAIEQPDTTPVYPTGPSAVSMPNSDVIMRELSVQDIEEIIVAFGKAAIRAKSAGFDAVEIHGAHSTIPNKFTSPLSNKRTDRYGGSLENRIRLPLEIVAEIRRQIGTDYPILYRLGADDMTPGGLTIQEGRRIAVALVEAGVDVIDVSGGLVGYQHPTLKSQGYFIPMAEEIKRAARVPVIGVGGITEPVYANRVIRERRVDMVAVGRAILNDPEWARKAVDILSGIGAQSRLPLSE